MHMKNWMLEPTGIAGVTPLNPASIPQFVNQLTKPPVHVPVFTQHGVANYTVTYKKVRLQLLPPGFPQTLQFAYGGKVNFAEAGQTPNIQTAFTFPGPTFEAVRGRPIKVHYVNDLQGDHIFPVDPTIMGANVNNAPIPEPPFTPFPPGYEAFQDPIPVVTHLHGGVTRSDSDGFPTAWFTRGEAKKGPTFTGSTFTYPNAQLATTLWYHDHSLGMTRLTVAAGLEGTYLVREQNDPIAPLLPSGKYEIPLMLTDRAFNSDGSIHFTQVGDNPDIHPYWDPEYFGDTILVNGKVWPNLRVDRHQYRFRIVNGSNARFYNLKLSNGMSFTQIGGDGSYLPAPVTKTEALIARGAAGHPDRLLQPARRHQGHPEEHRQCPLPRRRPDRSRHHRPRDEVRGAQHDGRASARPAGAPHHHPHPGRDRGHRQPQAVHVERAGERRR
jgi:hypothetical protein